MYDKMSYVCIVCSTTFTRKSSAIRHSVNMHEGTAFFVRLIDYIVGRMQGRYQPSNPLLNRQKNRNEMNLRNLKREIKTQKASGRMRLNDSLPYNVDQDITKRKKPYENTTLTPDSNSQSLEWILKFQDLATIVRNNYNEKDANDILSIIIGLQPEGKEIDKWLEFFRNIDRNRRT